MQIKDIKCAQKNQIDLEISAMKDVGIQEIENQEIRNNPFLNKAKKVKLISLEDF